MSKYNKKLIIRIREEDEKIIDDMRKNHHVNMSSLIRTLLANYYKVLKEK